ncbi:MAG: hypothetical protein COW00_09685 [Bdellovibrio sp. CG12_big_fil_rev_8_21_14_0_65_39_13]|nr:MAG: hypothetical protein COW78_16010 [Bdellovibrio sp. CG22_combo_CG10-13_8_21_14_all_39_27]PIQ59570.1 MAG: hypothetical protein COW00_09685 [Bdellovibrio sp. CG12_big_fil_rev_8_21_14_0_65_39_13]PIR33194.1 MAG: hypothetical protein COV37_17260 [Bdellovibrio sp. CG11_big_fil_rev_8_21_14_0_20_39_38]
MENQDVFLKMRESLKLYISKNYSSTEEFCWDKDVNKATVSNFLNGKKDFQLSTLIKIAQAMEKNLKIGLE